MRSRTHSTRRLQAPLCGATLGPDAASCEQTDQAHPQHGHWALCGCGCILNCGLTSSLSPLVREALPSPSATTLVLLLGRAQRLFLLGPSLVLLLLLGSGLCAAPAS